MKKLILITVLGLITLPSFSQTTVTNFTGYDCAGKYHDFFSEMNSGTVIVMSFVMPCGACASASLTAYNVVQSYATSNPGRVVMYVSDDYADTPCNSLSSWVNSNSMPNAIKFSTSSLKMSDYGTAGMPKVVVIGGSDHKILYNANNSVSSTLIKSAVTTGIAATTGISDEVKGISTTNLFIHPATNIATISLNFPTKNFVKIEVLNSLGQIVTTVHSGTLPQGENKVDFSTSKLNHGIYFVKITETQSTKIMKMVVSQ